MDPRRGAGPGPAAGLKHVICAMNTRRLLIVFLSLLGVFILSQLFSPKRTTRSFRSDLVQVDTAKVTAMTLYPRSEGHRPLTFVRSERGWTVSNGLLQVEADAGGVRNALIQMLDITPDRLVARRQDAWEDFYVTDSLATRVRLQEGRKTVLDLYIGRFTIQRDIEDATSYVRLGGEDEVYETSGLLSLGFDRGFNAWRNRTIVRVEPEQVDRAVFEYPADSGFVLSREVGGWTVDGAPTDSAAVARFLNRLRNLVSQNFVEGVVVPEPGAFRLRIEGAGMDPVSVRAQPGSDGTGYVIRSSQNLEATFESERDGIGSDLFKRREEFVPQR